MMFNLAIIAALLLVGFTIGVLFGLVLSFWIAEWWSRRQEPPICNQPLGPAPKKIRNMWSR